MARSKKVEVVQDVRLPNADVGSTLNAGLQEMTRVALRKLSAGPAKEGAVEKPGYRLHPDRKLV
jgi:hypothetical protein